MITTLVVVLLALILAQLGYGAAFLLALLRESIPPAGDAACPPALVVMPVRGADETLARCLEAIVGQDYPRFDVRVVVDRREDPAWEVIQRVVAEQGARNVRVEELRTRRETCSLKCSSVVQAVTELDPAYGFVAHVDADVVPHPTWLREMAAGFDAPSVGAVTGHRWYVPPDAGWGSLVRWLWNLAAVPQMYVFGIPWGGSMAVRADLLESGGLRDEWSRALAEDSSLTAPLRRTGHRIRFLPSLMMVDRSACSLRELEGWIRRQYVCVRLHHPGWPLASAHGNAVSALLLLVVTAGILAALLGDGAAALLALSALLVWEVMMLTGAAILEWAVRRRIRRRGEDPGWPSLRGALRCLLVLPLTQALSARAMLTASRVRTVSWRDVRYRVGEGSVILESAEPGVTEATRA